MTGFFKQAYLKALFALLPLAFGRLLRNQDVKAEFSHLPPGATFGFRVFALPLQVNYRRTLSGLRRVKDVTPDLLVTCNSLDMLYEVATGAVALREAFAHRSMSVRGDAKVGLTLAYLFDALFKNIYFWRRTHAEL
jgi:hypothetical protein